MFYQLRTKIAKDRFYQLTKGILDTPPMPIKDAPWSIISMVASGDVQMYLLSLKSFYHRLGRGKVIAIIDRDMPVASRATLESHFPGIKFVILEDIDTGPCQRGGTWERILYLLDHARHEYAIQMDCDTFTVGDIGEVIRCAENNTAFTLSSRGEQIVGLAETAEYARTTNSDYIGIATERFLDRYPNAEAFRYVRASSGFAGFAQGGFPRVGIEAFHVTMEKFLGARWKEWGTEQNASNFAVANSPGAIVLPYPKYANFTPDMERGVSSFFHFFGTFRYRDDYFAQCAQNLFAELQS